MARHSLREARALLLTGAPGSGKTTIVRRVASELSGARLAMPPSASGSDCAFTSCFAFGNVFAHNALETL